MNKKTIAWVVIAIGAVVLILGLSNSAKQNKVSKTLDIGVLSTLTGSAAFIGESTMKGAEIGREKALAKHKDLMINLHHEDSLFTPKGGIDAYTKLRDTVGIDAVITQASNVSVGVQPVAATDSMLHLGVSTLAGNFSTPNDLSARFTAKGDVEALATVEYLKSKGLKKLGVIYLTNEIGVSLKDSLAKNIAGTDIKIVAEEGMAPEKKDFRTILSKMKSAGVDSIYIANVAPALAVALTQASELKINVPFLSYRAAEDPVLLSAAGKLAENVIYTNAYDIHGVNDPNKEFVAAYQAKYGIDPNGYAAEAYEAVRLAADVYEKCVNDAVCQKSYLLSVQNRPSLFGPLSFDVNGDVNYKFFLKTVRDGKFVRLD